VIRTLGGLDVVVIAAGVSSRQNVVDMHVSEFDRIVDTNLRGLLRVSCQVSTPRPTRRARLRSSA
jgi:NADP-dependent 3-hydroxy acid dehydrogenase YdfG